MKYILFAFVAIILAACETGPNQTSTGVPTGDPVTAPHGWPDFCERYPSECEDPQ